VNRYNYLIHLIR